MTGPTQLGKFSERKTIHLCMALIAVLSFLVAGLSSAQDSVAAKTDDLYQGAEFRRWSAVVADIDETIHLYTDILGLELGEVTTDPKTSYVFDIFNIDRSITTRHATFHAGEKRRVLSVVEVPGQELPRPPNAPRMSVALFNANGRFDEIVERLRAEDYQVLPPHALGTQGIEIGFIDRDGHLYALYEFPYSGKIEVAR